MLDEATQINEQQTTKWIDLWTKDMLDTLGIDTVSAKALRPENQYLLFVYGPQMIERMLEESQSFSFQQYMALACWEGLKAIVTGNNPVGALMVVRENGLEYIFADHNRTQSEGKKYHHAEQGAIDAWEDWDGNLDDRRLMLIRKAPDDKKLRMLVTTREPCAQMCTGRILITRPRINAVMIGTADEGGGGMLDGRQQGLSDDAKRDWQEAGLLVSAADFTNTHSPNYIGEDFETFMMQTFKEGRFKTKEPFRPRPMLSELVRSNAKNESRLRELSTPLVFGKGLTTSQIKIIQG